MGMCTVKVTEPHAVHARDLQGEVTRGTDAILALRGWSRNPILQAQGAPGADARIAGPG